MRTASPPFAGWSGEDWLLRLDSARQPLNPVPDLAIQILGPVVAALIGLQFNLGPGFRKLLARLLCHLDWAHLVFGGVEDVEAASGTVLERWKLILLEHGVRNQGAGDSRLRLECKRIRD